MNNNMVLYTPKYIKIYMPDSYIIILKVENVL